MAYIRKSSGTLEQFDPEKLRRSLLIPGTNPHTADAIVAYVRKNIQHFRSSEDIFRYALDQLKEENPHSATGYNLKQALLDFGPTGFPFEKFVAEIFTAQHYQTQLNQIRSGWCVDHEIDVIVHKDQEYALVECKFHTVQSYVTHVQVPLYIQARFQDIQQSWQPPYPEARLGHPWIVTNTNFTYEAIKYGNCKKIKLLAWGYPKGQGLAHLIDSLHLYPLTAIPYLNQHEKKMLIGQGMTLCKHVAENTLQLHKMGLQDAVIHKVQQCVLP